MDEDIPEALDAAVEGAGFEVVRLDFFPDLRRIRLLADRDPAGITVRECVHLNRLLQDVLASLGLDPGEYSVEVSSPGLDRPLTRPAHFERFRGRSARIRLRGDGDARRTIEGRILGLVEGGIEVAVEGTAPLGIPFERIEEARLVPLFPEVRDHRPKRSKRNRHKR